MNWVMSLRSHIGLPTDAVYDLVEPWHPVFIRGSVTVRYFEQAITPFWAIAYCNGSAFITRQGELIDTWASGELPQLYERMFQALALVPL